MSVESTSPAMTIADTDSCAHCATALTAHNDDPTFGLCAGCRRARYCGPACQREAWCGCFFRAQFARLLQTAPHSCETNPNYRPGHKKECKQAQKALAAAALASGGGETEAVVFAGPDFATQEKAGSTCAPCDHCAAATPETELLVCTGCYQARYCSLACQHGAWFVAAFFF